MRSSDYTDEMRMSGLLPAGGALLYAAGAWIGPGLGAYQGAAIAAAMTLAGFTITRRPLVGRALASTALTAWILLTSQFLAGSPVAALLCWLPIVWLLAALWVVPGYRGCAGGRDGRADLCARMARVRVSLRLVAPLAVAVALSREESAAQAHAALALSLIALAVFTLRVRPPTAIQRRWLAAIFAALPLGAVVICGGRNTSDVANILLLFTVLITSAFVRERRHGALVASPWWEHLLDNPARQLVTTFLFLILMGTLLLDLPLASPDREPVALVDAAFTSVSAVCVTGLIVLDTPADWSVWGQAIILILIQLGGLGIMSFATAFLSALGERLPVRQEGAFAQLASGENRRDLYAAVRTVLLVTLLVELAGALVLLPRFLAAGDGPGLAVWRSAFTAVSAFCNAGFALQADSLAGFARDPWVLHAVGTMIIIGGLSPAVVVGLARRGRRTPIHTKLVFWTTGTLLAVGAALFAASEWNNTLAGLGFWGKIHNTWFQSVTLRTAGFSSIDFPALCPATVTLCVLWMFIGGSPGGTAGGIKTTTLAVLVLAVAATVKGRRNATVFGRTISHATVYRAASVATIGVVAMALMVMAIQLTQDVGVVPGIFEVASALGTVGLSMGATAALDTVGKIIIMVAMFAGRVGSLTLIMFLIAQQPSSSLRVPEENVAVG